MQYRSLISNGATLVTNALPPGSHLIRFHGDGGGYSQAVVVTEMDEGRTLFLQGWVGPPLPRATFLPAIAMLFPASVEIQFDRKHSDGTFRSVRVRI